ncbi:hypothetical protein SUGI_1022950 [Cryptomeria japonica]|uniref:uncharacterized protein LOC131075853 n=1 Tax=Cryptomeria japonica TaxID=3369 RepID=UPI002414788E|nr:uncharacterized protein LOC131075853 [Cryptomeria japonica]GLJ48460.1 hypothetical protein SUGI_1022950 [Cryptomeria japonica]
MESGGTRMGSRSSTRYGPASVFSGPVRKWKKRWIPYPSSSSTTTSTSSTAPTSKLCLYKWTSINGGTKDETAEEPPPRKVHYVPACVIEEQRKEAVNAEEETENAEVAAATEDSNKGDTEMAEAVEPVTVDAEEAKVDP